MPELKKLPYLKLYVQDYLTDEKLNLCSAQAQGVYIKILCLLHKSDPYGQILLKQKDKQKSSTCLNFALKFAKLLPFGLDVIKSSLDELLEEDVLQIEGDVLSQKRMIRDAEISATRAKAGQKGGKKSAQKSSNFAQAKDQANTQANTQAKGQANSDSDSDYNNKSKKKERGSKGRGRKERGPLDNMILTDLPFSSPEFADAWEEWKAHRWEKDGFSYATAASQRKAAKALFNASGQDEALAIAMIDQSIDRGWDGFFELKGTHLDAWNKAKGTGAKMTGMDYLRAKANLVSV